MSDPLFAVIGHRSTAGERHHRSSSGFGERSGAVGHLARDAVGTPEETETCGVGAGACTTEDLPALLNRSLTLCLRICNW